MEVAIRMIEAPEALEFCRQFTRERVDSKVIEGTQYLGAIVKNKLVGVVGWLKIGNVLRYKSDCVSPNFRGNGIYQMLFEERDKYCKNMAVRKVTAFCTDKSVNTYLRHGFCSIRVGKNGITFVQR